ncbi:DNA-binding domain protein [Mycobacterium xenopi 3993]|nr:DNA-binding domain protein [Mycobacterium xenopi 3993]
MKFRSEADQAAATHDGPTRRAVVQLLLESGRSPRAGSVSGWACRLPVYAVISMR